MSKCACSNPQYMKFHIPGGDTYKIGWKEFVRLAGHHRHKDEIADECRRLGASFKESNGHLERDCSACNYCSVREGESVKGLRFVNSHECWNTVADRACEYSKRGQDISVEVSYFDVETGQVVKAVQHSCAFFEAAFNVLYKDIFLPTDRTRHFDSDSIRDLSAGGSWRVCGKMTLFERVESYFFLNFPRLAKAVFHPMKGA